MRTSKTATFGAHGTDHARMDLIPSCCIRLARKRACGMGLSAYARAPVPGAAHDKKNTFYSALTARARIIADLDGNGKVSFIERKRIVADRNEDNMLSLTEWEWADFPVDYGPYNGHVSSDGFLHPNEFKYYMSYHGCTVRGSIAYSRPISQFPWDPACPIELVVFPNTPFSPGVSAVGPAGIDSRHPGYSMRVLGNITERLLWQPKVTYVSKDVARSDLAQLKLGPPDLATNTFKIALLTEDSKVPDEWTCSDTLFPDDGFVVVARSQDVPIVMYLIAGKLVISPHFINFFCSLFFFVLGVGHVIWIIERCSRLHAPCPACPPRVFHKQVRRLGLRV